MKSTLYERQLQWGAKMGSYYDWQLPLYFNTGTVKEHRALRQTAALFDLSHLGQIRIWGQEAFDLLDFVATCDMNQMEEGTLLYALFCNESGGTVAQGWIFCLQKAEFLVLTDTATMEPLQRHLQNYIRQLNVQIHPLNQSILALQGPVAPTIVREVLKESVTLEPDHFYQLSYHGTPLILSYKKQAHLPYYEMILDPSIAPTLWDELLLKGLFAGLIPAGYSALEVFRVEVAKPAYGAELSLEIAPTESVMESAINWKKPFFLGKDALELLETTPERRRQWGLILDQKIAVTSGSLILKEQQVIGTITSASISLTIHQSIAIGVSQKQLAPKERVFVSARQRLIPAEVVALPFVSFEQEVVSSSIGDFA